MPEQSERMGSKRVRYRKPSGGKYYMMSVFLDQIYQDRYCHDAWSIFNLKKKRPSWSNTSVALTKKYQELYGNSKDFEDITSSMMRKNINELDERGILRKLENQRATSEYKYYPNETTEGYLALIDYVKDDYRRGYFPNREFMIDPLYGNYSEMVLNRQFVLDVLRKNGDSICTVYNGKLVDIPLFGRYKKNYETHDRLQQMLDNLVKAKELISDTKNKDYRKVMELFGDNSKLDRKSLRLNKTIRKSNLEMIDRIIDGMSKEIDFMKAYGDILNGKADDALKENFSDRLMREYKEHIDEIAPDYPKFILSSIATKGLSYYRQEANWIDIELTGQETSELESIEEGLSEFYKQFIDENIVMPILCLIQMSPNALYAFTSTKGWPIPDRIYSYSSDNTIRPVWTIKAANLDQKTESYLIQNKSVNTLIWILTRAALIDYLAGNIRTNRITDSHRGMNRTTLKSFGQCCLKVDEKDAIRYYALFTFSVYREYTVSIYVSENPGYNLMEDLMGLSPDEPYPLIYDWSPAIGIVYKGLESPFVRGHEILDLISSTYGFENVTLRGIIGRAIRDGRI